MPPSHATIAPAGPDDAEEVATMAGELLAEISRAIGYDAFHFDLDATRVRLQDFLRRGLYFVLVARDPATAAALGFIALYEAHALYAGGAFGTIAELHVRPAARSHGIGRELLAAARALGSTRGWTRLEVTTPPLPQFERTLAFYEREGFAVSGGRKLRTEL